MSSQREVRAARRGDVPQLVDLRIQHLGAVARLEPPARLSPDARSRIEQILPVWLGQDDRVILVAEAEKTAADNGDGPLVGYAMGILNIWPPVLRSQHVGEILECYVVPPRRGKGVGHHLLKVLTDILCGRGAKVLRASVPIRNEAARERLGHEGYDPLYYVMTRSLDDL